MHPPVVMIQMVLETVAPDGREREWYRSLRAVVLPVAAGGDAASCRVLLDAADSHHFYCVLEWRELVLLRRELRSDRFRAVLSLMECSAAPPVLLFRSLGEPRGLELVAEARDQPLDLPPAPGHDASH